MKTEDQRDADRPSAGLDREAVKERFEEIGHAIAELEVHAVYLEQEKLAAQAQAALGKVGQFRAWLLNSDLARPAQTREGALMEVAADLARQPCSTVGVEDAEPGCCPSCRARAILALAPTDRVAELEGALKAAIGHIEHMAAWIGRTNRGAPNTFFYSFESLGEDMPSIKAALPSEERGSGQ